MTGSKRDGGGVRLSVYRPICAVLSSLFSNNKKEIKARGAYVPYKMYSTISVQLVISN